MRVLVTGATGLIGRHLLRRIAPVHEVFALARRGLPAATEGVRVEWVHQDLAEPLDTEALPGRVDAIVHLAQSQAYRDFPDGAEDLFEVNVHSTFRLLEYARRAEAERFVLASTGGVYRHSPKPIPEGAPLALSGPYFRSKRIAELLLDDYGDLLTAVTLRFFFVYGPGRGRTLVPRLAARITRGEELVVDGDPGMRINPLYVEDAAAAVAAALDLRERAVVNVAGEEVVSVTELIGRLAKALGRTASIRHSGAQPEGDLVADTTTMSAELGVSPSTSLEDGLAEVARSLLDDHAEKAALAE